MSKAEQKQNTVRRSTKTARRNAAAGTKEPAATSVSLRALWHNARFRSVLMTAVSGALLLGALALMTTMAWYRTERENAPKEDNITSAESGMTSAPYYTVFVEEPRMNNQTPVLDGNGKQVYDFVAHSSSDSDVALPIYDFVFNENDHTAAFIRIPISGSELEDIPTLQITVSLNTSSGGEGFLLAGDNLTTETGMALTDTDTQTIRKTMSNVVSLSGMLINETGVADLATNAKTQFAGANPAPASRRFVSGTAISASDQALNLTSLTKTNSVSFTINNYATLLNAGGGWLYYYIKVDYDWHLMDAYLRSAKGTGLSGMIGEVQADTFASTNDFQKITISDLP